MKPGKVPKRTKLGLYRTTEENPYLGAELVIHEDVTVGFFLLMFLSIYDILFRLYRWNERATLNTAPRLTGPGT